MTPIHDRESAKEFAGAILWMVSVPGILWSWLIVKIRGEER
tara:strand:- start:38047 stop:38169 length:123 start_codon:yes stop_codon:yes gene_type:complete